MNYITAHVSRGTSPAAFLNLNFIKMFAVSGIYGSRALFVILLFKNVETREIFVFYFARLARHA